MKVLLPLALLAILLMSSPCQAEQCATILPSAARRALPDARSWQAVTVKDLLADDQSLWGSVHDQLCPGIAKGAFVDQGQISYAVALIHRNKSGNLLETLVLLRRHGNAFTCLTIVAPTSVVSPFVVWRVPPGRYKGVSRGSVISISHDSFVYEKMEAVATQYYYVRGELRTLITAN